MSDKNTFDAMSVFREIKSFMSAAPPNYDTSEKMGLAIDRIVELIAADVEYDEARTEMNRREACEMSDEGLATLERWHKASDRRAVALAAVKGE